MPGQSKATKRRMRPHGRRGVTIKCENCAFWRPMCGVRRNDPVCRCPDSNRYMIFTGAADGCGYFQRRGMDA